MNILLIDHYGGSPDMGMEFRPYYFAKEWIKMGHRVCIVAADYSHLRMKNPEVSHDFQREVIDGIPYCWIKAGDYEGNGVKRALTMFRFVGKLWLRAGEIAEKWKPDVVITSSTYPLDTYAGQRIAKKSGARLIHEVHDLWPLTLIELGGMKRTNPFVMLIQAGEDSAYRNSDYVVSLLPCAKEYMIKHGMREDKFVNIQNGIVLEEWEYGEKIPELHQRLLESLKRDGKFIVGYFGGHALSNALDTLLEVAKDMRMNKVAFVLVGDGVEKASLMKRAKQEQIENTYFLDMVPKACIKDLTRYFDCSYIGGKNSSLYRFGASPNKMYDSMIAGKPIICAVNISGCLIEEYQCGIMVKTQKKEDICQAIEDIYHMSQEERDRMGEHGREAVIKNFNYQVLAERFERLFIQDRMDTEV